MEGVGAKIPYDLAKIFFFFILVCFRLPGSNRTLFPILLLFQPCSKELITQWLILIPNRDLFQGFH